MQADLWQLDLWQHLYRLLRIQWNARHWNGELHRKRGMECAGHYWWGPSLSLCVSLFLSLSVSLYFSLSLSLSLSLYKSKNTTVSFVRWNLHTIQPHKLYWTQWYTITVKILFFNRKFNTKKYLKLKKSTPVTRRVENYDCCPNNYTMLDFYLHVQRKPLYYVINLITPTSIITLISIVGFFR